jgi:hypothetical protein
MKNTFIHPHSIAEYISVCPQMGESKKNSFFALAACSIVPKTGISEEVAIHFDDYLYGIQK